MFEFILELIAICFSHSRLGFEAIQQMIDWDFAYNNYY